MRYRIVYQKAPLVIEYWYCEYMMQIGAILRKRVPDTQHRIEVKGTDGKYYSASVWSPK